MPANGVRTAVLAYTRFFVVKWSVICPAFLRRQPALCGKYPANSVDAMLSPNLGGSDSGGDSDVNRRIDKHRAFCTQLYMTDTTLAENTFTTDTTYTIVQTDRVQTASIS